MTAPKEKRTKTLQPCFYLGHAMYVPHLENPGMWVTFGGKKLKSMQELIVGGARVKHEMLFEQEIPNNWVKNIKVF